MHVAFQAVGSHRNDETARSSVDCVHHWDVESPAGHDSLGRCRRCGATRSFSNFIEGAKWERTDWLRTEGSVSPIRTPKTVDGTDSADGA